MAKQKKLSPIHPGEILKKEFIEPLGITAYRVAKDIHTPATRISEIIKGRRLLLPIQRYALAATSARQQNFG